MKVEKRFEELTLHMAKATVLLFSLRRSCTGVTLHCTISSGSLGSLHVAFVPQNNTDPSESLNELECLGEILRKYHRPIEEKLSHP